MNISKLQTPAILVNLDALEHNIQTYQALCDQHQKQLWPMIKTHKSSEIVRMQMDAGATGMLCGTLDEAEACCRASIPTVMYAYPVASKASIDRVIELTKQCDFILRLDDLNGAKMINQAAVEAGIQISYTIIVDCGLHRFGVEVDHLVEFAHALSKLKGLRLRGISTHPGHVYAAACKQDVAKYVEDERSYMKKAAQLLTKAGFRLEYITSGSTPTFEANVSDDTINVFHPGNYVFFDTIQMSIEAAAIQDCSLSILATVISHPKPDLYICDAGAKCLGLDQGAHGNTAIVGFGTVKDHPELMIYSLSEEVGKIHVNGETNLRVGDQIEIIPNHSCSSANLTSHLIGVRGSQVEKILETDMRGNSTTKGI